jgi:hypothetical protein
MIFLFPGVLFRRAFFSGEFKKRFDAGNTFERVLWSILFSFLSVISFCFAINFINSIFGLTFQFDLKNDQILDSFICVYENRFPTAFLSVESLINSIKLLSSLYLFSILIGYLFNKIVFYLGLEKRYAILKFQDNWQYLTSSTKQNNSNHSIGDIHYTKVDIKTSNQELFTGKLHEILYDKEGKIEAIAIKEAYKFYKYKIKEEQSKIDYIKETHRDDDPSIIILFENEDEFVYRKRIKGDLFSILNNNIENISITYIKTSGFYEKFQKKINIILAILALIIVLFFFSYMVWDFQLIPFNNTSKRVLFCLITPFVSLFSIHSFICILNLKSLLKNYKLYLNNIKDVFLILILFSIPYLYVFNLVKGLYCVLIFILWLIFIGKFMSKKQ